MRFKAEINVMPMEEILDPQGKVVQNNLGKLGIQQVERVRIGKRIALELQAKDEAEARSKVDEACKKLLANLIMETYEFTLEQVED